MKIKCLSSRLFVLTVIAMSSFVFLGCSSDDDSPSKGDDSQSFTIDGKPYSVNLSSLGINPYPDSDLLNGTVIITGGNESTIGSLVFSLNFPASDGVEGTYGPSGDIVSAYTFTSHHAAYGIQNGSDIQNGGDAQGQVKVVHHGGDEYTIQFNFKFSDGIEASGNLKREFPAP
ncbi:hypothetical protein [Sinomicrobium sp.]